ncbi:conjugative transposon protein TraN, partial [Phocaeicola vulgatus]|nr:conjugative transposon protein TraN [Phocaeicola vulgatus]
MKKILMMLALIAGTVAAYAQQSSGDYYEGLSRKIGFSRMIPPHGLEITYDKTVH